MSTIRPSDRIYILQQLENGSFCPTCSKTYIYFKDCVRLENIYEAPKSFDTQICLLFWEQTLQP